MNIKTLAVFFTFWTCLAAHSAFAANPTDDSYSVDEGGIIFLQSDTGVLANDIYIDEDPIPVVLVDNATSGTLFLMEDGAFYYEHDGSEDPTDSFTYFLDSPALESILVTVTLNINPMNDAPVALGDSFEAQHGLTLSGNVLTNDMDPEGDTLQAILVEDVTNGNLILNADGSFDYTHDGSASTADSFTYKNNDGSLDSNTVTVNFSILVPATASIPTTTTITVLANQEDKLVFDAPTDLTGSWEVTTNLAATSYDLRVGRDNRAEVQVKHIGAYDLDFTDNGAILVSRRILVRQPVAPPDPYASDVVLLLDFEEPDGSNVFTDLSAEGQIVNPYGAAVIRTDNPRIGSGSLFLDGESWLQIPVNDSLVFGSEAVTIDFWIYSQSVDYREDFISFDVAGGGDYTSILYYPNHSQMSLYERNGGTGTLANVDIRNGWHHIAYVRDGVNTRFYLDGVERHNAPSTSTELLGRSDFYIGGWRPSPGYHPHPTHGYIDKFRVTRAVRYTAGFDPNTEP